MEICNQTGAKFTEHFLVSAFLDSGGCFSSCLPAALTVSSQRRDTTLTVQKRQAPNEEEAKNRDCHWEGDGKRKTSSLKKAMSAHFLLSLSAKMSVHLNYWLSL